MDVVAHLETFRPYGFVHVVVAIAAVVAWVIVVRRARRLRGTPGEIRFCRSMGWFVLTTNLVYVAWLLAPFNWNLDVSLPLHLCDFAWMACVWAMFRRDLLPRRLIYYWGFGLTLQAFFTPTVDEGPTQLRFWTYWLLHWEIVAIAFMETIAFGLRPGWRALVATFLVTLGLYVAVFAFNAVFETPYFFNGPGDDAVAGTPIALLGDWPLRVVWLGLAVLGLFVLMTLPWIVVRRRAARR